MLFTSLSQFVVLLLMLVVGWLFGFASHSGGRKWKQAAREEQAARTELERRNAELVAERDSARAAASARPQAPADRPAAQPAPSTAKRGWFDWGSGDDLTRLRGVDSELARRLYDQGVATFAEVANLSDADEIALERRIDLPAGYIQREQLREQARLLADRDDAGHAKRFG